MAAPFRTTVIEQWIDYNGHLNEGYFGVVFGDASDDLLTQLGFDAGYRQEQRGTFYTVETHIRFLHELKLGDQLRVEMRILGVDPKRVHVWHEMYRDRDGALAATQEAMFVHVNIDEVRAAPMTDELYAAALREWRAGTDNETPSAAGGGIRTIAMLDDGASTT